jgi:hypothetical protein
MDRWMGVLLSCAWILWAQGSMGFTRAYNSYLTKSECESERQVALQRQAKLPEPRQTLTLVCLPDTVNLRQQPR